MSDNKPMNISFQGEPSSFVPQKVNLFALNSTPDGIFLDAAYNTKMPDNQNNVTAFNAQRYIVDPADLKSLADTIYQHLINVGYLENVKPSSNSDQV